MTTPTYDKSITALLVVDPYNDFISEGGKIWPHIKAVAEANHCVPNMLQVLNAARQAKLRVFYELVALAPDVIFSLGSIPVALLQRATRTIPIVFMNVPDPVGAGFVQSMAHPGGNITGFSNFEYSMSGKWAELLKQIAPQATRALVLCDPSSAAGIGQFAAIRSIAQTLGVELTPSNVRDTDEIERNVAAFARSSNGGVIVTTGGSAAHRKLIISLVDRYKLPTVYPYRYYTVDGGLISYGPDTHDPVQRAAGYVDRILKGEKPADMPVQAPTKYELVINLRTAKALGLTIPQSLVATADEVIE